MRRLIPSILLGLAGVGAALLYGGTRWGKRTDQLRARLQAARGPVAPATYQ